ncbi:carbon storage regulator [Pseudomonas frederiksbergensis]|uniref:carbon storage regulator n=1 Tax=Bacteria TaxID=2 RepID=UPI000627720A|nr:carbon storage regulator [Stutzerimonas stutzeri]
MTTILRKVGESICIGENIRVTVLSIKGGQVRIAIDAPVDVVVRRQELYERFKPEHE